MLIHLSSLVLFSFLAFAASAPTAPALVYSSYLRDGFTPNAIATDSAGNIYLAGNVVVDPDALQTTILVIKLNPQASQYLYVRYLGGSVYDSANAIAVDAAGNAYVAGQTASPDFPVTTGGNLGTPATGTKDERSFVTKLDPNGNVVFSDVLGVSSVSTAQAVVVTPAGQVVVSGTVQSSGFIATAGAYSVPSSKGHPYLLQLDPTGTKLVFAATGIGGSALALDPSGSIYIAGSTTLLDYPTTPGVYQPAFPSILSCNQPCSASFQGANQYVTKVDPTGSKLIYSTSLSGTGTTYNAGLAVDTQGNAYLTGEAGQGYPYSVKTPPPTQPALGTNPGLPFLSKLDPAGQTLLFSVPVGGQGVQVDSAGSVYVAGRVASREGGSGNYNIPNTLPAVASVPAPCLPGGLFIQNSAYVAHVDGASGDVLGTQWIGGSHLNLSTVALSGSTLWVAGPTSAPDAPFTPNSFGSLGLAMDPGAYLGAVDFSQAQPASGTPQVGCVLDAADSSPAGPVARYQLLSLFGTAIGPAAGVSATDNSTTNLAGVSVTFGTVPAILLYVSSTQINLAVPAVVFNQSTAVMQVTVNGLSSQPRQFPLAEPNPHLYMNAAATYDVTKNPNQLFVPLALNGDGSLNSSVQPAQPGSTVSVFVNGLAPVPGAVTSFLQPYAAGLWSVENVVQVMPFLVRIDLQAPSSLNINALPINTGYDNGVYSVGLQLFTYSGLPFRPSVDVIYVSR